VFYFQRICAACCSLAGVLAARALTLLACLGHVLAFVVKDKKAVGKASGTTGTTFAMVLGWIGAFMPFLIILENVKSLTDGGHDSNLVACKQKVMALGYEVVDFMVQSQQFGKKTRRSRIFILCFRIVHATLDRASLTPEYLLNLSIPPRSLQECLWESDDPRVAQWLDTRWATTPTLKNWEQIHEQKFKAQGLIRTGDFPDWMDAQLLENRLQPREREVLQFVLATDLGCPNRFAEALFVDVSQGLNRISGFVVQDETPCFHVGSKIVVITKDPQLPEASAKARLLTGAEALGFQGFHHSLYEGLIEPAKIRQALCYRGVCIVVESRVIYTSLVLAANA
jgi:hypothetical protein